MLSAEVPERGNINSRSWIFYYTTILGLEKTLLNLLIYCWKESWDLNMIIHCVTIQHHTMQTKHHWMVEHCDRPLFLAFIHTHTHSYINMQFRFCESKRAGKIDQGFLIRIRLPQFHKHKDWLCWRPTKELQPLTNQKPSLTRSHTRTSTHTESIIRAPFFLLLTLTEKLLQTPTHVHTKTWWVREREWLRELRSGWEGKRENVSNT